MKEEILRALRETDGYVSGQELCEKLGVSRTAVWKNIKSLQDDGYEIEAVPKRGYRLAGMPATSAASVPGRMGIHWSARMPAVAEKRGSITMTFAPPFSSAFVIW